MKNKRALPETTWSANHYWDISFRPVSVLSLSLFLFGLGEGLLVLSNLGSAPWTVLSQGIALKTGSNIGFITLLVSVVVMLTWIPFRQKVGLGTVFNILLIAAGLGISTALMIPPETVWVRILYCLFGIVMIGVCSAFYLTCHMGAGPRDGLMVGFFQLTGWRIGAIRTGIEASVCLIGYLLGGVVGIGTILFAIGLGWVLQLSLAFLEKHFTK